MCRCPHQVAHPVKTDVVRLDGNAALVPDRSETRLQAGCLPFLISMACAIDHIVAVRFNDKGMLQHLTERNEQGSQLRLTLGMQVHLRLLDQKARALCPQYAYENG